MGGGGKMSMGCLNSRSVGGFVYEDSASTVTIMILPRQISLSLPTLLLSLRSPVYRKSGPHFRYSGGLNEVCATGGST
jgi:hypothetical protein